MANSIYYTVNDLIESVVRRGSVPISEHTINNGDIIRFANEEIEENIVALILSTREELFLTSEDITLEANKYNYDIPYRAIGSKVRVIKPVLSDNSEGLPLIPVALEHVYQFNDSYANNYQNGFYLENDQIVIIPDLYSLGTTTIRVYYYLRPNSIVELTRAAKIRSIDFDNNSVTVETVPSNISNSTLVDLIQAKPNHKTYDFDLSVSVNTANKTITFSELPENLQVGDYVCTAGETPTPQIPVDILPLLEQSAVCKVLEAIGDTEGLKNAYVRLQKLEERLFNVIDNRIEAPGRKIVNVGGFIRRGVRGWGRW